MSFLTPPSSIPLRSFTLYPTPTTLQGLTCPTPTTLTLSLRSRLTTVPLTSILSKPYKINPKPLPPSHDHLGDISLSFDGAKIIGPAEAAGGISGNSLHSPGRIIEYDSSTLKTLDSYETSQDHIPWLSLNPSDGILYSSEFDNFNS
ncbi:hypothetical protein TrLO_g9695 [Triparma laevis f. longispina]|uniref:Uncharacterized protein n=1 Tax=Triparma laevis f. longispina TaxID=1714387 RepID=A0A9W7FGR5_9STRA|nr:hypothetical protein TrLO_g9695 [Triparma laevis f. longispina]